MVHTSATHNLKHTNCNILSATHYCYTLVASHWLQHVTATNIGHVKHVCGVHSIWYTLLQRTDCNNLLQHASATHWLQHTDCDILLQHTNCSALTAIHGLQHTDCNAPLQHTTRHVNPIFGVQGMVHTTATQWLQHSNCNTLLQHATATRHCNTPLQHTTGDV